MGVEAQTLRAGESESVCKVSWTRVRRRNASSTYSRPLVDREERWPESLMRGGTSVLSSAGQVARLLAGAASKAQLGACSSTWVVDGTECHRARDAAAGREQTESARS